MNSQNSLNNTVTVEQSSLNKFIRSASTDSDEEDRKKEEIEFLK